MTTKIKEMFRLRSVWTILKMAALTAARVSSCSYPVWVARLRRSAGVSVRAGCPWCTAYTARVGIPVKQHYIIPVNVVEPVPNGTSNFLPFKTNTRVDKTNVDEPNRSEEPDGFYSKQDYFIHSLQITWWFLVEVVSKKGSFKNRESRVAFEL